jgi:hypothetical protein
LGAARRAARFGTDIVFRVSELNLKKQSVMKNEKTRSTVASKASKLMTGAKKEVKSAASHVQSHARAAVNTAVDRKKPEHRW